MVPVLLVLVYHPVLETRMSKAVSSGETSVSRPKKRYVETLLVGGLVLSGEEQPWFVVESLHQGLTQTTANKEFTNRIQTCIP